MRREMPGDVIVREPTLRRRFIEYGQESKPSFFLWPNRAFVLAQELCVSYKKMGFPQAYTWLQDELLSLRDFWWSQTLGRIRSTLEHVSFWLNSVDFHSSIHYLDLYLLVSLLPNRQAKDHIICVCAIGCFGQTFLSIKIWCTSAHKFFLGTGHCKAFGLGFDWETFRCMFPICWDSWRGVLTSVENNRDDDMSRCLNLSCLVTEVDPVVRSLDFVRGILHGTFRQPSGSSWAACRSQRLHSDHIQICQDCIKIVLKEHTWVPDHGLILVAIALFGFIRLDRGDVPVSTSKFKHLLAWNDSITGKEMLLWDLLIQDPTLALPIAAALLRWRKVQEPSPTGGLGHALAARHGQTMLETMLLQWLKTWASA